MSTKKRGWRFWLGLFLILWMFGWWATLRRDAGKPAPQVTVNVIREPPSTLSEQNMDARFLTFLDKWADDAVRETAKGAKPVTFATYERAGGRRVALVRGSMEGRERMALIVGFKEKSLVTVICGIDFADVVPLDSGPCDERIRQEFGGPLEFKS